ncbi:MAG: lytic transglycosylase domain-containing protein [Bacteroidales bacterium]
MSKIPLLKNSFSRIILSLIVVFVVVSATSMNFGKNDSAQVVLSNSYKTEQISTVAKPLGIKYYESPSIPKHVEFAGERVPLECNDVFESLDRELMSHAYFHSQTLRYIKLSKRYFSIVEPILKKYNIPDDFKYLMVAESGMNETAVSPARAAGLWQFLASTAKSHGLTISSEVDERYHVEKSTVAACDHLQWLYNQFGSWTLVCASYNCGIGGLKNQISRQKTNSYYDMLLNSETARYVYRILGFKLIMENPELYNFHVADNEYYPLWNTKYITIDSTVTDFGTFANNMGLNYKILKEFNPWLRDNKLNNPNKTVYKIKIPLEGYKRN